MSVKHEVTITQKTIGVEVVSTHDDDMLQWVLVNLGEAGFPLYAHGWENIDGERVYVAHFGKADYDDSQQDLDELFATIVRLKDGSSG